MAVVHNALRFLHLSILAIGGIRHSLLLATLHPLPTFLYYIYYPKHARCYTYHIYAWCMASYKTHNLVSYWFSSGALALRSFLGPYYNMYIIYITINLQCGDWNLGYYIPLPLTIVLSSMLSWLNKNMYASPITFSNSHVASFGSRCFHCTFTWPIAQFHSIISFWSWMCVGSPWNSPLGST